MQSKSAASAYVAKIAAATKNKTARTTLLAEMKKTIDAAVGGAKVKLVKTKLLRARTLRIGDGPVDIVTELDTATPSLEIGEIYVQMGTGLEHAAPTIAGSLDPGQILTANPGSWTGPPPTFTCECPSATRQAKTARQSQPTQPIAST